MCTARHMRRAARSASRGQSIVELAGVLIVFIALFAGMIDVGRVYMYYQAVQAGAREGARFGITGRALPGLDRQGSIRQTVLDSTREGLLASDVTIEYVRNGV